MCWCCNTPDTSTPHLFSIPAAAYAAITNKGNPQAIIISGESGSGKTEATKKCLQYLSTVAPSSHISTAKSDATTVTDSDIRFGE